MSFKYALDPAWQEPLPVLGEVVQLFKKELSLPTLLCRLLIARGYEDPEVAKDYLRLSLDKLEDARTLTGITEASERLSKAIRNREKILIHGDYDVDGVVGTALITRWIQRLGGYCVPFIPNRLTAGYDFGPAGLRRAIELKAQLILTVDSGIRAHEMVSQANENGIEVIITDHHVPGDSLPNASSIVNPNRSDCKYTNKGLCGTGVVYRLCEVLADDFDVSDEDLRGYLDFVALATIADVVPLTTENRTFVRFGLHVLKHSPNCGLKALMNMISRDNHALTSGYLAFQVAPRINAAGRMGEVKTALGLLMEDDPKFARENSLKLESENVKRKREESVIMEQVLVSLEQTFDPQRDYGVVLSGEDWHPGVIGIVASRIAELLNRPTVVISLNDQKGRGSARSIPGFDLLSVLNICSGHLEKFGGHRAAAGLTICASEIDAFKRAFNLEASQHVKGQDLRPILKPDLEIQLSEINQRTFDLLSYFGPFGISNSTPLFLARNVKLVGPVKKVGKNHLRLRVEEQGHKFDAVGFNLTDRIPPKSVKSPVDIVFKLKENLFRGVSRIELQVMDLRPSEGPHKPISLVYS